jgi:hypothetical protein
LGQALSSSEARTKDRNEGLTKMLAERAEKETSDITAILTELERASFGVRCSRYLRQGASHDRRGSDRMGSR